MSLGQRTCSDLLTPAALPVEAVDADNVQHSEAAATLHRQASIMPCMKIVLPD